jgi:hypothetical protein
MIVEKVLSPIKDDKINSHLKDSEIWKKAYHPEEVTDEIRAKHPSWYEYTIKFENTTPIQMTKMRPL